MSEVGSSRRPDWPLAVVVGAGGMGMSVARRLGQSHRLLLADRDETHVKGQVSRLENDGYDATAVVCDVTQPDEVDRLARQAGLSGPVKALANVVGLSVNADDFRAIMAVNLVGASTVAEAFRDVMEPGGCAVFISSSAAHMSSVSEDLWPLLDDPMHGDFLTSLEARLGSSATAAEAYSLSKFALNRMCQRNAVSWGARGLRVVSLSPGLIATPMGAEAYKHSPAKFRLFEAIPLAREGTMLEIANVVEFLVSDKASFISGTDILVDGGLIGCLRFQSSDPADGAA